MSRRPVRTLAVLLLAGFAAAGLACGRADTGVSHARQWIRPEPIRAHVRFLADDALEGRGTATRGMLVATNYVAAQFEALGLEPAGDPGSYFQLVPLRRIELDTGESYVELRRAGRTQRLRFGADYLMRGHEVMTEVEVEAPVVFAGFGVSAPELGYDDYAAADVTGAVVAMFSGAPKSFPSSERAHFSSTTLKMAEAARRGAIGILQLRTEEDERLYTWAQVQGFYDSPAMRWLGPDGVPNDPRPELEGRALLSLETSASLFLGADRSWEDALAVAAAGRAQAFPLPVRVRMRTRSKHERLECANVAAVLRGADPALRDEFIVYSAHLDHVGIGAPRNGDAIYNGAVDNASGTAVMLEVARAFARLPERPRRSILFLAVTAEETGLLGSDFFAQFPTVARNGIVANLNLDAPPIFYPLGDVVLHGAEHSTLGMTGHRAAARLGIAVSPDPMPEQTLFIRSDQYSFVKRGIPALFPVQGFRSSDASVDGAAFLAEWLRTRYHTPRDDIQQPLDFASAAAAGQLLFLIGQDVAAAAERPAWNEDSFFGKTFARR
jgi:hypothetical protein